MNIRISRSFVVSYPGQFCIVCGREVEAGETGCFYGDEIAHYDCASEDGQRSVYIPQFEFDPDRWDK